jgi:hypothetical protein
MNIKEWVDNEINEMARRSDIVNFDAIEKTMKQMKSAGIDLTKYTLDEIKLAFFLAIDDTTKGEQHQKNVMLRWKPSASSEPDANYRAYRKKIETLLDLDAAEVRKAGNEKLTFLGLYNMTKDSQEYKKDVKKELIVPVK